MALELAVGLTQVAFVLSLTGLVCVGAVSWGRTRNLRHGRLSQAAGGAAGPPGAPAVIRTLRRSSAATHLAALAGCAATAWGVLSAARGSAATGLPVCAWGTLIALSGLMARVTGVAADPRGLRIGYAARPGFEVAWEECLALTTPRTPLGGWTVHAISGRRTLMPSDLFGQEEVLKAVVRLAGLHFAGRDWISEDAPDQPKVIVPVI